MKPLRTSRFVAIAFAALSVAACGGGGGGDGGGGGGPSGPVSFSADIQPIFNGQCIVCHASGGTAAFLSLTAADSYANLFNVASTMTTGGGLRVDPSNSATSVLYMRVSGVGLDSTESTMPPGFTIPPAQQILIRDWIDQGAANN